jgi:hypothetical protein
MPEPVTDSCVLPPANMREGLAVSATVAPLQGGGAGGTGTGAGGTGTGAGGTGTGAGGTGTGAGGTGAGGGGGGGTGTGAGGGGGGGGGGTGGGTKQTMLPAIEYVLQSAAVAVHVLLVHVLAAQLVSGVQLGAGGGVYVQVNE